MNGHTQPSARWKRPLLLFLLAAAAALLAFLGLTTVYSSDDFWYSTFMDHGAVNYLRMMREHYLTFNGRMLVHFFAQMILHWGSPLFAAFLVGCCVAIPAALYATGEGEKSPEGLLLCLLLFLAGILLLPRNAAVNGLLWISAFCNYVLPTAMAAGEILLFRRVVQREGRLGVAGGMSLLFCFLCGATTEQMGAVAAGVEVLFALKCLFEKNKRIWLCLVGAGCALCGLLTIFLSPATRRRAETETLGDMTAVSGFIDHMKKQIQVQADFFADSWFLLAVLGGLFLFTGWVLLRKGAARRWVGLWYVLAAVSLVLLRVGRESLLVPAYLAVIALTALQTAVWLRAGYEGPAFLLLAGLASAVIILFTASGGDRTFLPFCLCLLAALAWAGTMALEMAPSGAVYGGVVIALSLLSFAVVGVQLPGYWYNYQVDRQNRRYAAQAAETGVLYYDMSYNRSYTYVKPYEDGYFYEKWLESVGVDPDTCRIYLYREGLPNVYAGGERTGSPAVSGGGGWLLPLRGVVEALGGSLELIDPSGNAITIHLGDREYDYVARGSQVTVQWTDDGGAHQMEGERAQDYYATCISEEIYTQAFGLEVRHENGEIRVEFPSAR